MSGYGTLSRTSTPRGIKYTSGYVGQPGSAGLTIPVTTESQSTYSYRSTSSGEDEDLSRDLAIFRNGFTTFDPKYDRGHEFSSVKRYCSTATFPEVYLRCTYNGSQLFYRGPLIPSPGNGGPMSVYPPALGWSGSQTASYGQRAIINCSPTNPNAALSQFVGEAREGLPSIPGLATYRGGIQIFRSLGSEYLNVQFGWKPFVSDLKKFVKAYQSLSRILLQYESGSGRQTRRRFYFPAETTSTEMPYSPSSYWNHIDSIFQPTSGWPSQTKIRRIERSIWFSGAFTYYVPVGDGVANKLRYYDSLANKLLGTRLTPDVLWELAPWSWLVDWKLQVGQCLKSASMFTDDGLALRYGYLMVHTTSTDTYYIGPTKTRGGLSDVPPSTISLVTEEKLRYRATPYGFGLNTADFTAQQWAILAALGITRSFKSL